MSEPAAFSIATFCKRNGISQSFYFKIAGQGLGPATTDVGRRKLITPEAEKEWHHNHRSKHTAQAEREVGGDGE
jgi:hypothetical protein